MTRSSSASSWRSSARCATPSCAGCTARACAAACCSTARPGAARPSWPGRWRARWAPGSSRCPSSTCSTCGSGNSERNLHELFEAARRNAPCVLFLDEIDALGQKRAQLSPARCVPWATSCSPSWTAWTATTRACSCWPPRTPRGTSTPRCAGPGRLDRMVLVRRRTRRRAPRSSSTTCATGRSQHRPGASSSRATEDFSGADLAHLCETAAEFAMQDRIAHGRDPDDRAARPRRALHARSARRPGLVRHRPQRGAVRQRGRRYDDLVAYLKRRKLL